MVPCFNRPADLAALLADLPTLQLRCSLGPIDLRVIVVDNASTPPLQIPASPALSSPQVLLLRLPTNSGGSGGFNAGLSAWLDLEAPASAAGLDLLWLLDSDARLRPDSLVPLVEALAADPSITIIGPGIADPRDWRVHEIGGMIDRRTGVMRPLHRTIAECEGRGPLECDYVAACCALVRRDAVERHGLLPDRFLNADDAEWCVRLAREAKGRVCVLPTCSAAHPPFDRYTTWARFYGTRNLMGPVHALGLGPMVRLRRSLAEVRKALNMSMMGRQDLAEHHVIALRHAARRATLGPAPRDLPPLVPLTPAREFAGAVSGAIKPTRNGEKPLPVWVHPRVTKDPSEFGWISAELGSAGIVACFDSDAPPAPGTGTLAKLARSLAVPIRALTGPPRRVAIVPAAGKPAAWLAGTTSLCVTHDAFYAHAPRGLRCLADALGTALRALGPASRLALQPNSPDPLPRRIPNLGAFIVEHADRARAPHLAGFSVVILSFNRRESLRQTLRHVGADPSTAAAQVVVVDNASTDGSPAMVRAEFPDAELIELPTNIAVAGFNIGVAAARESIVLVLDDDARPDPASLAAALRTLRSDPSLAAIPLHPRHPDTGMSEWPFAQSSRAESIAASGRWPIMGCGNLVRRDDWLAVGGYDETFFLYRNDVDLAMKLLAAGRGITYRPEWVVWHDSPAATRKSARWFELATRNWLWLCRRHARGARAWIGAAIGWVWAHRLAGIQPAMHLRVLRGVLRSFRRPPPQVPPCVRSGSNAGGRAFADYLALQIWGRGGGVTTGSPMPSRSRERVFATASSEPELDPPVVVVPRGGNPSTAASSSRHSA